eukprot:2427706-Rhodomonas_salina.2
MSVGIEVACGITRAVCQLPFECAHVCWQCCRACLRRCYVLSVHAYSADPAALYTAVDCPRLEGTRPAHHDFSS